MKPALQLSRGVTFSRNRLVRFALVGAMGIVVQLIMLTTLVALGLGYLVATALAVELTILHNFVWHECFTWNDRAAATMMQLFRRLLRLNGAAGSISFIGNLGLMRILVGMAHVDIVVSNLIAVGCCSLLNFVINDRMIFTAAPNEKV